MKKFLAKVAIALGAIGAFVGVNSAKAADALLDPALASSSLNVTNAGPGILNYIVIIGGVCLGIGALIAAVILGIKWVKASISGGKGKRR